jgi:SAM-dependent methyltransferase
VADRPYPGDALAERVIGHPDRAAFFATGERSVKETTGLLAVADRRFEDFARILDWGAGCGRVATWLDNLPSELHACDTDAEAVAWMAENLGHVHAVTNDPLPPLPYPDVHFDLVYNHSVLTHIDEAMQDAWLAELRRVTEPGGVVILTVHGEFALARDPDRVDPSDADRVHYDEHGILFIRWPQQNFPDWYGITYHAAWYVFEHWSRYFRVLAYAPRHSVGVQDMVLLTREDEPNLYHRAPTRRAVAPPPSLLRRAINRLR